MNKVVKTLVLVFAVLTLGVLVVPTLADDFKGVIIPSNAVLYHTDGELNIITADADGNWSNAISMTDEELAAYPEAPAADTLVISAGNLSIYKLTSGEWQVSNGPDAEGKTHVVVFDAGWGEYHSYDLVDGVAQ